ncbi:AsmA family protein [Sphingomonas nostoxanthinifaciens]|uniref:AsmA family protein n=1 Tax=Sphingomonas nostoxanthinifaciens TaxID=2872652 RepID=UPI001CC1EF98|nr:AsmA family protein [Sphingomonas nostoxanthinifaciens]UAK25155.1 AsmA family protein [Sphingomonas nostoxanthinifaciens]
MADASTAEPGIVSPRHPAPRDPRRRDAATTALASVIGVLTTLIGLIFLAWFILFVTKGRFLKHTFERIASSQSGRSVRVAGDFNFYFDPIATKFLAEGLTVSNPDWATKPNLFSSTLIDTRIDTLSLIFGSQRRVSWINLVNGAADLEWDPAHKRNTWTFSIEGKPFQIPLIERAAVDGTTLRYRDPAMKLSADIAFKSVDASNNRVDNAIRFTGTGTARGTPFTLSGAQTSPNQLIAGGKNQFELHADAVHSHVDVSGTLPGATVIEGADLAVAVRGQNLRNLFDLAGIAVPDTRAYRIRGHLTKQGNDYRFTKLVGAYGNSDIAGALSVAVPPANDPQARMKLTADLSSRLVDMIDIGPFVGYNPNTLATKGATAAATTQHKSDGVPRILPDAPLRIDAIKTFDADVKYRIADIRQPFIPVSNIVLGLTLDHSLLQIQPLDFDMAGGHVTSVIAINARGPAVVTDTDIRMSPTPMGNLLARFGVSQSGTTGTIKARIQMHGIGDTVRKSLATSNGRIAVILPRGTFWTSYTQLSEFDIGTFVQRMFQKKLKEPVQINCGLIGFTVRDGIAAADPVLIDTSKNVMTSKGGFSFRDESLNLLFRADAKKISLFSAQSPVGITGHFAQPGIQIITPQLLARVGASVALGVVATPVAALAAFVDPGDAKAAACGPVLAGADAAAQRTDKGKARKDVGNGQTADEQKQAAPKKVLGVKLK